MSEAIHILLVDDAPADSAFIQAFKTRARDFDFVVSHVDRGKSAIENLRVNPFKYKALVIDARCIWDGTQQFPSDKFLSRMVAELERLENELNTKYPAVVNTAYADDFADEQQLISSRGGAIFLKSGDWDDEEKLFTFLKDKITRTIEWEHASVYQLFDKGILAPDLRSSIDTILKRRNDVLTVGDNFNSIRKMLEHAYIRLRELRPGYIPDEVFFAKNQEINLTWILRYLTGQVVDTPNGTYKADTSVALPLHLRPCLTATHYLSNTGSHFYSTIPDRSMIYEYRCAMNGLIAFLIWLGEVCDASNEVDSPPQTIH